MRIKGLYLQGTELSAFLFLFQKAAGSISSWVDEICRRLPPNAPGWRIYEDGKLKSDCVKRTA